MNLKKLQHYIAQYRKFLRRNPDYDGVFVWESQQIWQNNFDLDAPDFAKMYDTALQNSHTKRLWKGNNYLPKQMMLKFAQASPDFVRSMFRDLFNENKEIVGRVGRFVYHCDELLREYKTKNPRSNENNHFHDDNFHIVSLYLAFQYPTEYAICEFKDFSKMLALLGSTDVPEIADFGRYAKVSRTLYKLLSKDEDLMKFHKTRLKKDGLYQEESLLLVYDFIKACVNFREVRAFREV